jgi:hypothetical protein
MRIGFVSTRLKGIDGVSLEVQKWAKIMRRLGHAVFFCAGELGEYAFEGSLVPLMHFQHPAILALNERAFSLEAEHDQGLLMDEIRRLSAEIRIHLRSVYAWLS